jgi:hypothetical protein
MVLVYGTHKTKKKFNMAKVYQTHVRNTIQYKINVLYQVFQNYESIYYTPSLLFDACPEHIFMFVKTTDTLDHVQNMRYITVIIILLCFRDAIKHDGRNNLIHTYWYIHTCISTS